MEEVTYLDEKGNVVTSDKATRAIMREVDKDGNLIKETFYDVNDFGKRNTDIVEIYEPTPEMKKIIDEFIRKSKEKENKKENE